MDICNTNRLRVTVTDARKYHVAPGIGHYRSGDHGMRRLESNWDVVIGRLWLNVKWRPDGKRRTV